MMANLAPHGSARTSTGSERELAQALERGEVVYFPKSPFALLEADDHRFLLEQELGRASHKNISYDPHKGRLGGYRRRDAEQVERLRRVLRQFSECATAWLGSLLPRYAACWKLDRVSFRPEEEARRRLRQTARNDLVHVDAFPTRPTHGDRILRLFVNVNPSEPRVWVTSDPFGKLLSRYGTHAGLPDGSGPSWTEKVTERVLRLFQSARRSRSAYDAFMLRFHDFLKANDEFQEHCPKRYWNFQPGSVWLAITDTASHAVLRGRFALEHSYFLPLEALALPQESPAVLLERFQSAPMVRHAA